jgi:pimeloyl-ACP methyl ester carboxylesterase
MRQTLSSSLAQLKKSWYMFFFQIPFMPEAILRNNDWEGMVKMLRSGSKPGSFSNEDIDRYCHAWWRKDAITSMLNWYRAVIQMPPEIIGTLRIQVPTLILWGALDIALGREMARPSLDLCDQGKLVFFENSSHWVQHDEAEAVNKYLLDFFSPA